MNIIAEHINQAISDRKVVCFQDLVLDPPAWHSFENLFDTTLDSDINFQFFGGMTIADSERHVRHFDEIIDIFSSIHPGEKISVMSIVHFVNKNNNDLSEETLQFANKFVARNPNKPIPNFDLNLLQPSRHSDAVDGLFLQCNGSTLWNIFYEGSTEEIIANPGDVLFIPKGIEHSVESLTPRSSISISFTDQQQS